MLFMSNDLFFGVLLFGSFYSLISRGKIKEITNCFFALSAFVTVNILSAQVLKPIFKRPRPFEELKDMYLLLKPAEYGYAFPSTNAAMLTALACVLSDDYRKLMTYMSALVVFVGFICVYSGGHYPFDVIAASLFWDC